MSRRLAAIVASSAIIALLAVVGLLLRETPPTPISRPSESTPALRPVATQPVRGRVVDGAGRPIAGATVRCDTTALQTDAAGAFRCPLWDDGQHRLLAYAEGYADVRLTGRGAIAVNLDPNPKTGVSASRGPWVLTLRRPIRLRGHVVRGARPVAGAKVSVSYLAARGLQRDLPPFQLRHRVTTDARGAYTLAGLPPGRLLIRAVGPGGSVGQTPPMDLSDGAKRDRVLVRLHAAASLAVQVRSAAGGALPAELALRSSEGGPPLKTTCDDRGRCELSAIPAGSWRLVATAVGHHPSSATKIELRPHDAQSRSIILLPLSGIVGTVRDAAGMAVASAAIVLNCPEGRKMVRSTAKGGFRWATPKRPCDVRAVHPGFARSPDARAVPGRPVTLVLGIGGSIRGAVLDDAGNGVAGALIRVEGRKVSGEDPLGVPALQPSHSQPDGSFSLGPLRPGEYVLRASAARHPPGAATRVQVRSARPTSNVTLTLNAGAVVTGVVSDAEGVAVAGALVQLRGGGQSGTWPRTGLSDADGRYRLGPAPGGTYLLLATSAGALPTRLPAVTVPERGELSQNVSLRSLKGAQRVEVQSIGLALREASSGVVIDAVTAGSAAERAGVVKGDQVVSVDFQPALTLGIAATAKALQGVSVQVTAEVRGANGHARTVYLTPAN